jgi:hypothetical protein
MMRRLSSARSRFRPAGIGIGWGVDEDAGMATAELAVALPAVVLILSMLVVAGRLELAQLRCDDAARIAARWRARGEDVAQGRAVAARAAPAGATISVTLSGPWVRARVVAVVDPGWRIGPPIQVSGLAVAAMEEP